jgi:hypothetical protein
MESAERWSRFIQAAIKGTAFARDPIRLGTACSRKIRAAKVLEHSTNAERTVYDDRNFALEITQQRRGIDEVSRPEADGLTANGFCTGSFSDEQRRA